MLKYSFAVFFSFISIHVVALELIPMDNGFYYANCYTKTDIEDLAKTDSIQSLLLSYDRKNPENETEINLKSPQFLTELVIWCRHPDGIRFKDSLINLISLSIEGSVEDSLSIRFNPNRIKDLALDFGTSNFNYLERFVNVDSLLVIYSGSDRKMFETLQKLPRLIYLNIINRRHEIELRSSLFEGHQILTLVGNMKFTNENVNILLQQDRLEAIAFSYVRVKIFSDDIRKLAQTKRVYLDKPRKCKPALELALKGVGCHIVHPGGHLWE